MRVIEEDVYMTLGLPKSSLETIEAKHETNWLDHDSVSKHGEMIEMMESQIDGGEEFKRNFIIFIVPTCLRRNQRGGVNYLILNTLLDLGKVTPYTNYEIKSWAEHEFEVEFGKGYLKNSLDTTTVTDEEVVHEEERRNRSVETEAKVKDQIKGQGHDRIGRVASWSTHPLKRVRKLIAGLMSDELTRDMPKKSKSKTLVLSMILYELKDFLMEIDVVEK
ncbi:hypothetical protein Cgig2_004301 [Carnegiea gigantea]|uniref:Uncharacterized protein n=1 Tax=Carnegiea gigantea TaxID=171969 RepID=A0A9Q1QB89_9CARY|nr:hypothetical protein Cgig2_004301 [Carnegiea gigantea]